MSSLDPRFQAFGMEVRRRRTDLGWSQEALAQHVGLDRAYAGRVERGEVNLSLAKVLRLADALGVPVSTLFEGIDLEPRAKP